MLGVMGICSSGLRFATPDGKPVHCMVLLVSPEGQEDHHLEVLAALARVIVDRNVREELFHAKTPAHAYELLHGDAQEEDLDDYLDSEDA